MLTLKDFILRPKRQSLTNVSKRVKARYNVLNENMVPRRGVEPWSSAFKADVITVTPQANPQ